jgi:hypothetical protein
MGSSKRMMEEEMEIGFSRFGDVFVCAQCFCDPGIRSFVEHHCEAVQCSYCESPDRACRMDLLMVHLLEGISLEWGDPANEGLGYETRAGGWQGEVYDSMDLLYEVGIECCSDRLLNDIQSALYQHEWCELDPYSLPADRIFVNGWERFCDFILHTARFVFFRAENTQYDPNQHDEINPVNILEVIGRACTKLDLVKKIPVDREIYRVRIVDQLVTLSSAAELGSPPDDLTHMPNRMSPVGISMFYGAFDERTAIEETFDAANFSGKKAVCGCFSPIRDLVVIDLSDAQHVPSLFDAERREFRSEYKFMAEFVNDFSKPIERGNKAHAEYVPTQVVTEYFRHVFRTKEGGKVDGVIYASSKTGRSAVVIFADSLACVDVGQATVHEALLVLNSFVEHDLKQYSNEKNNDSKDEVCTTLL